MDLGYSIDKAIFLAVHGHSSHCHQVPPGSCGPWASWSGKIGDIAMASMAEAPPGHENSGVTFYKYLKTKEKKWIPCISDICLRKKPRKAWTRWPDWESIDDSPLETSIKKMSHCYVTDYRRVRKMSCLKSIATGATRLLRSPTSSGTLE